MATHQIVIELDPRNVKAGMAEVDGSLRRSAGEAREFERAAAEAMRAVEKSAREAAREQERATRAAAKAAADSARQAASAQRAAAREVDETARALIIAAERRARERAEVEKKAARDAAEAAKKAAAERDQAERFAAKRTADYMAQVRADYKNAQAALANTYRSVVGPAAEYREKLNQIIQLERQGAITAQQRARAVAAMNRDVRQFNAQQQGGVRGAVSSALSSQFGAVAGPAAVAGLAIKAGQELVELGDEYTDLSNKIRQATESEAEMARVRDRLFKSAIAARVDVKQLTGLYAQMRIATKDLGTSQGELLRVSELLAKATRGVADANKQAGLQQFGQALSKGTLQAEELMSIMENIPRVGQLLAEGMGMTVGELRKAASEGKIGTQAMLDAIERMGPAIEANFGKSVATTAEAWTGIKNQVLETVGGFAEQIHLGEGVTKVVNELGSALRVVGGLVQMQLDTWRSIDRATGGIAGKIAMQPGFFGQIEQLSGRIASNYLFGADYIRLQNDLLKKSTAEIEKQTQEMERQLALDRYRGSSRDKDGFITGYGIGGNFLRESLDAAAPGGDAVLKSRSESYRKRLAAEKQATDEAARAARDGARDRDAAIRAYETMEGRLSTVTRATLELRDAEADLDKAVRLGITTKERSAEILARMRANLADQLDPYRATIEAIKEETEALRLDEYSRQRRAESMRIEHELLAKGVQLTADQRVQLELALVAQERARAAAEARAKTEAEVAKTVEAYSGRTLTDQFNEEASRAAQAGQKQMDALADSLRGVAGSFEDAMRSGSKSMSQLATNVAMEAAKILLQFTLLQGIRSVFGADSGITSLASRILSAGNFAGGGTYTVPNNGHGVDGVPLFMRVTPNEQITVTPPGAPAPNQAAPTAPPHVSIVNSVAPAMVHAAMDTPAGHRVIANVIERHIGQLSTMVRRSS